jgi:hypothetical protein
MTTGTPEINQEYVAKIASGARQTPGVVDEQLRNSNEDLAPLHQRIAERTGGHQADELARLHGFRDHEHMLYMAKHAVNHGHLPAIDSNTTFAEVASGVKNMLTGTYAPVAATGKLPPQRGELRTGSPWSASENYDSSASAKIGHGLLQLDNPGNFKILPNESGRSVMDLPVSDVNDIVQDWRDTSTNAVDNIGPLHGAVRAAHLTAKTAIAAATSAHEDVQRARNTHATAQEALDQANTARLAAIAAHTSAPTDETVSGMETAGNAHLLAKKDHAKATNDLARASVAYATLRDTAKKAIGAHQDALTARDNNDRLAEREDGIPVSGDDLAKMGNRRLRHNPLSQTDYTRQQNISPGSVFPPGVHKVVE